MIYVTLYYRQILMLKAAQSKHYIINFIHYFMILRRAKNEVK